MKHIYIVLIESYTGLGKLLKKFTGYRYEHIAVSLDKSLTEFYSFSRKQHHHPFAAGFMKECRDYYAFEEYQKFYSKIFSIPVTEEKYDEIRSFIDRLLEDDEQIFNLFAMLTTPIIHGFRLYKAHNCMDFTAKVIEMSGVKLDKPYYKYDIPDIEKLLVGYQYPMKEGYVKRIDSDEYEKYVEKSNFVTGVFEFLHAVKTLTVRLITKKPEEDKEFN
ncbi:MAG: hypothetical protein K6E47_08665 [Lachnospiraceae bacterium]|nr:hypothetical protein [Lachnospiraceae bacterium]